MMIWHSRIESDSAPALSPPLTGCTIGRRSAALSTINIPAP